MLAVIRLVAMLPGANAPNVSWVILLSGPVGVMSVSPVARPATTTSRKVMSTAITPIQYWLWRQWCPTHTVMTPSATNQPSIHSPGSHCPGRRGHWIHESHGLPVTFTQPNPLCPHSVTLIHAAFESRNQVMVAPSSTPSPSDFACLAAVPPPS